NKMVDSSDGYHTAKFNLKTNLPSFNSDQNDKKVVEDVKKLLERVILLILHKWKYFDKEDYDLNINWVEGKQTKNNTRHSLEERFGIPFPTINLINLNVLLFNSKVVQLYSPLRF
ncbi:8279_t:CDS:2, partial [Rhizophagus irregularis]